MITVQDLKELVRELQSTRNDIDQLEAQTTELNKKKASLEAKIAGHLKELNETNFKCEYGQVIRTTKWRVTTPKGEDKQKFFDFLRERGMFEEMATVNANTLNAYFNEQWDLAKQDDPMAALNFTIPGIGEPKEHEAISFRKK